MKKSIDLKGLIGGAWSVIFVLIFIISLVIDKNLDLISCLKDGLIEEEYHREFLWPTVYGKLGALLAIITFACGFVHIHCKMDIKSTTGSKGELLATNIAVTVQTMANIAYSIVSIGYLDCFSFFNVLLIAAIVFGIFSVIYNVKAYKNIQDEITRSKVWKTSVKYIIVVTVGIVVAFALNASKIPNGIKEAKENFKQVSNDKIDLCFGHLQGIEDNRVTVKVEFVNIYGASDKEYSLEQLEQEYTRFKNGEDGWDNLLAFCNESIAIELTYQRLESSTMSYPYGEGYGGSLLGYIGADDYGRNTEATHYAEGILGDVKFFGACVEDKLYENGLTMRQAGDSSNTDGYKIGDKECETATAVQVKEACESVSKELEGVDEAGIMVDSIDLDISYEIGKAIDDVVIIEENGYKIETESWYVMESRNGEPAKYEGISKKIEFVPGYKYRVLLEVSLPTAMVGNKYIQVNIDGIDVNYMEVEGTIRGSRIQAGERKTYNSFYIYLYFEIEE